MTLTGATIEAGTSYTLHVSGLTDRAGNGMWALDLAFSVSEALTYETLLDTTPPAVLAVLDVADGLFVLFDEPVVPLNGVSNAEIITVERSAGPVAGSTARLGPQLFKWTADEGAPWYPRQDYEITQLQVEDLATTPNTVTTLPGGFTHIATFPDQVLIAYSKPDHSVPLAQSQYGVTSLFQGRGWHGELGLYYYRARWYGAKLSSFLERDPSGYRDGQNGYGYLQWNSTHYLDPAGESTIVFIIGNGGDAGGLFMAAALTKKRQIEKGNPKDNVEIHEWGTQFSSKDELLDILKQPRVGDESVAEIHYFGHSFSGGLAIGYQDPAAYRFRNFFEYMYSSARPGGPPASPRAVLAAVEGDQGIVLRHDFVLNPKWKAARQQIRLNLEDDARAYLWGCMTTNVAEFEDIGYWRVFRGLQPARSFAKELAVYLDRPVVGTNVGSEFQILVNGNWVIPQRREKSDTSPNFEDITGRSFGSRPSDFTAFNTRLEPVGGAYQVVDP